MSEMAEVVKSHSVLCYVTCVTGDHAASTAAWTWPSRTPATGLEWNGPHFAEHPKGRPRDRAPQ